MISRSLDLEGIVFWGDKGISRVSYFESCLYLSYVIYLRDFKYTGDKMYCLKLLNLIIIDIKYRLLDIDLEINDNYV